MNKYYLCFVFLVIICNSQLVRASQTYTFTSANYSAGYITNYASCSGLANCANFSTSQRVSGSITLNSALPPNLSNYTITSSILSYNISDGIDVFTGGNSYIDSGTPVTVSTNSSGDITELNIIVGQWQNPANTAVGDYLNQFRLTPSSSRYELWHAVACLAVINGQCASLIQLNETSWVIPYTSVTYSTSPPSPAAVPTLSSWAQLFLMISLIGVMGWSYRHSMGSLR